MGAFRQGFAAITLIALAGWANAGQSAAPRGGKHVQPRPIVVVGGERTARLPLTLSAIRKRVAQSGDTLVKAMRLDGGFLIESRGGGLVAFTYWSAGTGRAYTLPVGPVTRMKVVQTLGDTDITLLNEATDDDGSYWPFPYLLRCVRSGETSQFACLRERAYFPLTSGAMFGSKPYETLTGIVPTLDGVELAFGPEQDLGEFWADYTSIPPARVSFDPAADVLLITFSHAVVGKGLVAPARGNVFIQAVAARQDGPNVAVALTLVKSTAQYYTGSIEHAQELPFLELRFASGTMNPTGIDLEY